MKIILRDSENPGYYRNVSLILIALIFCQIPLFSQLSDTLTIGGNKPDYASFTQAVDSLHTQGVNGPVVFNVRSGTYIEQIIIGNIPGSSAINTVVFQSETGDSTEVTLQYTLSEVTSNYIVMIDGGKFITFSGMTFKPAETSIYGKLIELKGYANNITFKNNLFLGLEKGGLDPRYAVIRGDDKNLFNITVSNNRFNNASVAVLLQGESHYDVPGSEITGNIMINCGYAGIYTNHVLAPHVTYNQIESKYDGISIHGDYGNGNYSYNRIIAAHTGIDITRLGDDPKKAQIVNNSVSVINPGELHGININNSIKIEILYNNVYLNTAYKSSSAFYATTGAGGVVVQNNNFVSENTGFAVYVTTPGAIATMNHNNLFSEGNYIAKWGDDFIFNIYDLQSVSGMNDSSLSVYPHFVSDSDLHVDSPWLDGKGTVIPGIIDDMDGNPRDTIYPDIGADEYTPDSDYTDKLNGTYTIGGSGVRNYEDFTSAINDAFIKGISDSVIFEIQSGTYNEQIKIRNIPGSSPVNTVTFRSATGNCEDVQISYAASSALENYVISFHASDFIRLENVSVLATGDQNAGVINISEGSDSIEIMNNHLEGRYSASANVRFSIILSEDCDYRSRIIQGNTIKKCSYGIYMKRESSSLQYPRGAVIKENVITESGYSGIYLQHHDSPLVNQNTISARSGIELRNSRGPAEVTRNKISSVTSEGIYIYYCQASADKRGLIANNFIQGGGTGDVAGISLNNAEHYSVLYNSVNITSSNTKAKAFYTGSLTATRLIIKNNIFFNKGGAYSYYITIPSTVVESDYNDLYTLGGSTLAYWGGVNYPSLDSLITASEKDQKSVSVNPNFVSDTDLHTTEAQLNGKATKVTEVTEDIDGDLRNNPGPDIGADEFGPITNNSIAGELWDVTDMSKPEPVTKADIILYPQGSLVDTTHIAIDGSNEYLFYGLEEGIYTVLAIPDKTSVLEYIPTYLGDKPTLYEATWVTVTGNVTGKDIHLIRKPAPRSGTGIIKGKIIMGTKNGLVLTENTGYIKSDAAEGVMVYLKGATDGTLIASDVSGSDGSFSFNNLDNGAYYFVADCQGKPMDPSNPAFVISDARKNIEILATVGADKIIVTDLSTGIDDRVTVGLKVYPVPAADYIMVELPETLVNGKSVRIRILDLSGKIIYKSEIHDSSGGPVSFNINSLRDGLYILEVKDNVTIQRMKILKSN